MCRKTLNTYIIQMIKVVFGLVLANDVIHTPSHKLYDEGDDMHCLDGPDDYSSGFDLVYIGNVVLHTYKCLE